MNNICDESKQPDILIVKPSSLGDVLHTFPAVVRIATEFPGAGIDWLIHDTLAPILDFLPPVRTAIPFPRKELGAPLTFLPAFLRTLKTLRRIRYRTVIDFQGLFRSAFFARCCRSRDVVGFSTPRESLARFLYHRKIPILSEASHAIERNLKLVCAAFDVEYDYIEYDLAEHDESANLISDLLSERGIEDNHIRIGIAPGARWESKRWPPEFFVEVMRRVASSQPAARFVLIGSEADRFSAEKIVGLFSGTEVVNCVGETNLGELVELIRRCHYLLTNDSGPMHIAATLRVPVFALFGPTDPDRCGPFGEGHRVFLAKTQCSGCYQRHCRSNAYQCHREISPEAVAQEVIQRITDS